MRTVKALLRGEVTEWDGAKIQMLHPDGFGAPRPIDVPFLLGAAGPKGKATAAEVADGVLLAGVDGTPDGGWQGSLFFGTVLDDGEDIGSERVMAAAGHGAAVFYHFWYENGRDMADLPGGPEWEKAYADVPADERHLAIHDLHLIAVNERDRDFVTGDLMAAIGSVFSPAQLRERLDAMEASGITEIAYQPAGPDIPRELEAFAAAVNG